MSVALIKKACSVIAKFEGFRRQPYKDEAGILTIGYGTIVGSKNLEEVSEENAFSLLFEDVKKRFEKLAHIIEINNFEDYEIIALLSFLYNLGFIPKFLTYLKTYDKKLIAEKILLYNKVRINGVLKESKGLKKRREEEVLIFTGQKNV